VGRVPLIKKYKIGPNQLQFQKLSQELPAMNLWDNKYYEASGSHDFIETVAWASRRMIVFALATSDGFVALSGTLAQYQGFPQSARTQWLNLDPNNTSLRCALGIERRRFERMLKSVQF
jgi:hypothetical protein